LAAIDFAPASMNGGCETSDQWVVAPASGLVTRSGNGVVVLDLDGDGKEQTGWVLLFLHIANAGRVKAGTFLDQGGYIGHPSCEGGVATGTHVHIARRYNGEWVLADGALPFNMDGWVVHAGAKPYLGTLTRGGDVVTACACGSLTTNIIREPQP
jgi:LasA protease